jgi:hypothetical protein
MSVNRAALKSLYVDTKKNQTTQLITSIVNSVKSVATSGKTFYDYDITRTTFGATAARHIPGPGPRGLMMHSFISSLTEFIDLLKEALGDCDVSVKVTTTDASGNVTVTDATVDASGNYTNAAGNPLSFTPTTKKAIHINWA